MNNYNYVFFYQIEKVQSIISIESKIFLFDVQIKEYKEKKSLRLTLFSTLKNFALPETIKIMVNGNAFCLKDFYRITRNNSVGLFGVIIDLPSVEQININDIYINEYSAHGEAQRFSKGVKLVLNEDNKNIKALNFLRDHDRDFILFPQVKPKYWQCKCGEINFQRDTYCENCGTKLSFIESIVKQGIQNYSFDLILKKREFDLDLTIDYLENCKKYYKKYLEQYFNLGDFITYSVEHGYESKFEKLRHDKLEEEIRDKRDKKKRKLIAIYFTALIMLIMIAYLFFTNPFKYFLGDVLLFTRAYQLSYNLYEQIPDYEDSNNKAIEAKYRYAKSLVDNGIYKDAVFILEPIIDHKDAENLMKEAAFYYAEELYNESNFDMALSYYQKADGYSSSKSKVTHLVMKTSLDEFNKQNYMKASYGFRKIMNISPEAERWYFISLDQHLRTTNYALKENKSLFGDYNIEVYEGLSKYKYESGMLNRILSDRYWYITLVGTWKTDNGKYYFKMNQDRVISYNTPSRKYEQIKIFDDKIYGKNKNESEWKPLFMIILTTSQYMNLYNYFDNKYYYMKLVR